MEESNIGIHPHGERGQRAILGEQTVSQREHGVDGIGGRSAISSREAKTHRSAPLALCAGFAIRFEHPGKLAEI